MCGDKLFLSESFIQNRFIADKAGQRFVFEDDVILGLVNTTQKIKIEPEEDMLLKVSSKQAYGVNLAMRLCDDHDCHGFSSQTGNTEILYAKAKKGGKYYLELDYSNSIIQLSSFFDCPHLHLKIAMMKTSDATKALQKPMTSS